MKQIITTQRVKLTWDRVTTARRYRIKIIHNGVRMARKLVRKPKAKFRETKFIDNESYTVYVRARGNKNYTKTDWTTFTFVFFDIDHDNDLISDADDPDDDNDGIPDTEDSDPYGVSGTVYPVTIKQNSFVNGTITLAQNDSVTWINQDEGGHAVSATNGQWYSPPLEANESYTHIFSAAGVFPYYDPTHPLLTSLTGTITVTSQ